ncbi:zinc finger protein 182-like [Macrosteles quadrilineatus]|uniref:zinc finger protein 182-like n=1 Tax=Macrosteles quadrilineatus TaxID=74068 RepID=UPI0023E298B2|nr:zinc finger protein 182-like [Macrosteles quadrilineatus]XP_054269591.1 zinc finger protein 182-like [Macrosteles quadrilineatus]
MADNNKNGYLTVATNSMIQQHLAAQSQQKLKMDEQQVNYSLKVPQVNHSQESFTMVPDDGLGYDDGVRVLRSIGTWAPDYSSSSSSQSYQPENSYNEVKKASPSTNASQTQTYQMSLQKPKPKVENNNKSFTCTECGKGLARKDKLVIHMRIHTGEKPYVCEVCKKAFSRRDKLVIHMNKLKHLTPSNLAPLSKRVPDSRPPQPQHTLVAPRKEMKDESTSMSPPPPPPPHPSVMPLDTTTYCGPFPQPDQSYCLMCHQSFTNRDQFMFHLRTHFRTPDSTQVCS